MVEFEINMIEMSPDYNDPNLVICDSGAQTSIFSNESLLFNIRDCDDAVKIGGISSSSKSFSVTKSGQLQGFEDIKVYVSPLSKRNILSLGDLLKHHRVTFSDNSAACEVIDSLDQVQDSHSRTTSSASCGKLMMCSSTQCMKIYPNCRQTK
jgi:hypothetical protein